MWKNKAVIKKVKKIDLSYLNPTVDLNLLDDGNIKWDINKIKVFPIVNKLQLNPSDSGYEIKVVQEKGTARFTLVAEKMTINKNKPFKKDIIKDLGYHKVNVPEEAGFIVISHFYYPYLFDPRGNIWLKINGEYIYNLPVKYDTAVTKVVSTKKNKTQPMTIEVGSTVQSTIQNPDICISIQYFEYSKVPMEIDKCSCLFIEEE